MRRFLCFLLFAMVLVAPMAMANTWNGFTAAPPLATDGSPEGVAVGDFNGDGIPDIAVANTGGNTVSILLGNGDGTFTLHSTIAIAGPVMIAVADFNGDGKLDLVVTCGSCASLSGIPYAGIASFLGNGDGTFTLKYTFTNPSGGSPGAIVVGDFNGDGKPDIAYVSNISYPVTLVHGYVEVFLGNGDGTFTQKSVPLSAASVTYPSLAVGDFNGDGKLDLVVTDHTNSKAYILLGKGDGTFTLKSTLTTGMWPDNPAVGDFNGDGIPDLAIANYESGGEIQIFLGKGDGTFTLKSTSAIGAGLQDIAIADFNEDGKLDIAAVNYATNTMSILLGNGDGTFSLTSSIATGSRPVMIVAGDFNGDGWPDLAVTNEGGNSVSIFLSGGVYNTTTNLVVSPTSGASGGTFSLTATITVPAGNPTGTVTFYDGATNLGSASVASKTANINTTALLSVGIHSISAVYSGNSDFYASTSNTVPVTISKANSATAIAGPNINFGQNEPVSVAVTPSGNANGTPTGTVACYEGSTNDGTATLSSGNGLVNISGLTVGSHSFYATYSGDSIFNGSTSSTITITVNKVAVGLAIGSSLNPSTYLSSVIITVTATGISGVIPTGTVTLTDGSTTLATITLDATGKATYTTSTLTAGSHPIAGTYNGDGNYF
jgi:hypothetical protein